MAKVGVSKGQLSALYGEAQDKMVVFGEELNKSAIETIAKLAAQMVASSLGALNASASLSGGYDESEGNRYSYNMGYNESLEERHNTEYK
jgi:hypothetical protein